jgi:sugar O-acyltransferase (sialic acid O-acetyltransferase NeuD family)
MHSYRAQNQNPLFIFGSSGHAASVANLAIQAGYNLEAFIDPYTEKGKKIYGRPVLQDIGHFEQHLPMLFSIAVGDNALREKIALDIKQKFQGSFPVIVHPTASIGVDAKLGEGTVVMPQAHVGPRSVLGAFTLVNTGAALDHDGCMDDFSSLAPGSVCGGYVRIGIRSAISIGATVLHQVTIGSDSVLGAASLLNKPLPSNVVAYGSPARIIRERQKGESYL